MIPLLVQFPRGGQLHPAPALTPLFGTNRSCLFSGGGLLVELMKQAAQTKQYAELDHAIKTKVEPFLYNKGNGSKIPIWKLVLLRNKDRPRHKLVKEQEQLYSPK